MQKTVSVSGIHVDEVDYLYMETAVRKQQLVTGPSPRGHQIPGLKRARDPDTAAIEGNTVKEEVDGTATAGHTFLFKKSFFFNI